MVTPRLLSIRGATVGQFLNQKYPDQRLPTPLTCLLDDNLEEVVGTILLFGFHRAWLVDDHNKPLHVISLTDVIQLVYRSEREHIKEKDE